MDGPRKGPDLNPLNRPNPANGALASPGWQCPRPIAYNPGMEKMHALRTQLASFVASQRNGLTAGHIAAETGLPLGVVQAVLAAPATLAAASLDGSRLAAGPVNGQR